VIENPKTLKNDSKLILLGEDDIDDQEFLMEVFSSIDGSLKIEPIANGERLVAYLDKSDDESLPRLIILDYNLPELNGAEILKILNNSERYSSIPKLVWSTSNSSLYRTKCLALGALAYIVKPNNIASFREIAKYIISFCN
jgi:CheY-like chemotaxis protein